MHWRSSGKTQFESVSVYISLIIIASVYPKRVCSASNHKHINTTFVYYSSHQSREHDTVDILLYAALFRGATANFLVLANCYNTEEPK